MSRKRLVVVAMVIGLLFLLNCRSVSTPDRVATGVAEAKVVAATLTSEASTNTPTVVLPTATPLPMVTKVPSPTKVPTHTPSRPTATSAPTSTSVPTPTESPSQAKVPAGWQLFTGKGLEMYLPAGWQGGTDEMLDKVFEEMKKMGPQIASFVSQLEAHRGEIRFFAFDIEALENNSSFLTNLNVGQVCAAIPFDKALLEDGCQNTEQAIKQLGGKFKCVQQELTTVGSYKEAGYTIADEELLGRKSKVIQYTIKQGDCFWIVTLSSAPEDFEKYRTILGTAMGTFRITD